ncbi:ester cyclase [Amnibacterium kyonggiense]
MSDEIVDGAGANLELMQRRREAMSAGDAAAVEALFSPGFVDHDPADGQPAGAAGLTWYWDGFERAFSDVRREVVHTVATPEHVVTVTRLSAVHTGEWQGHAPTGRSFSVRSVQVMRVEDGVIVERWGSTDVLGILQQLGLA